MNLPPCIYSLPKDCREEEFYEFVNNLITQIQDQATAMRISARIAKTQKATDKFIAKAESYEYVVLMLQAIKFERN